ncbi:MAG: AMP-binding protein [Methylocystis sp.]
MREIYDALRRRSLKDGDKLVFSDDADSLSQAELLSRAGALSRQLPSGVNTIGILAANGVDWAAAQLMGVATGKTVVPLPPFFSPEQLAHIVRDANVELILCGEGMRPENKSARWAPRSTEYGAPSGANSGYLRELAAV